MEAKVFTVARLRFPDKVEEPAKPKAKMPRNTPLPNLIGLQFLARHLVTLNFPKRMMYLKRTSVGPLTDDGSPTNAASGIERDEDLKEAALALSGANQ
ncbi:MAG: hypothetical protein E6L09_12645 [Verrucomicrobia bacterium]|nr:MAG: hypothetical protein E6L09_12645 [Verrucomicrobiota bacterium]